MESLKVLLVNGSPHKEGCVYTALSEIAGTLKEEDIQSEIFWVGNQPVAGCIGCGACIGKRSCFRKDTVNDFTALIDKYDGFIFGTPVHYAGASGSMTSFMDRVFFIDEFNGEHFAGKPAAAIACAVAILECNTWEYSRGDSTGHGRITDYASACKKYGLVVKMHTNRS